MVHGWSVHGLGKSWAKFWTAKFHPGIMRTICTNQFHLLKSSCNNYKPEYGLKIGTQICVWNFLAGNTGPPFQEFCFFLEVFHWNDPRDVILFHLFSNWILRNIFVNCKLPLTLGLFYSIDPSRFPLFLLLVFIIFSCDYVLVWKRRCKNRGYW